MKDLKMHLLALLCILVWGSSFVVSKFLLEFLSPVKLMLARFIVAYLCLLVLNHKRIPHSWKDELIFLLLGLFGGSVYYLFENTALTYTYTSNVSILTATTPLLTSVIAVLFLKDEKVHKSLFIGFCLAMVGVVMVVLNGTLVLKLNPLGDFLAFMASVAWLMYSLCLKKVMDRYDSMYISRKNIFYALITAVPLLLMEDGSWNLGQLFNPVSMMQLIYLGVIASGIAYIWWAEANQKLGIVKTTGYVYLNPVVTMICGAIFLKENIGLMPIIGTAFIILGMMISEK